jgi:hypothetical protein
VTLPTTEERAATVRRAAYAILIATSVGGMAGRILGVNAVDRLGVENHIVRKELDDLRKGLNEQGLPAAEVDAQVRSAEPEVRKRLAQQRPFLSSNDRSRWLTVRALVERGTFAVDEIQAEPNWDTIDMVRHDGKLYSSKPPLLATLLAGPYWLAHKLTGWTLGDHPYELGRALTLLVNVLPLGIAFVVLARLVERLGTTDWGRLFVVGAATWGTFLSTFAVTLNNHIVAAVSALLAVAAALPVWLDGERRWRYFAAAGFFAALTAANELPALTLLGLLGLALLWKAPRQTLLAGVPAALLVAAAAIGTNYLAVGSLRPPYAHRGDGPLIATVLDEGGQAAALDLGRLPRSLRDELTRHGHEVSASAEVRVVEPAVRWSILQDEDVDEKMFAVVRSDGRLSVHAWDNWYDYRYERGGKVRDSYWRTTSQRSPVDRGEPSRWMYIVHCLVGHHGIFSITPMWLLTVAGVALALRQPGSAARPLAVVTAVASLVCLAFYFAQGQENRNYGGMTSGLRWMFWFAPLWLLAMLPAADWCSRRRWSRGAALVLLALSVMSASYPTWNPWVHPWLVNWFNALGWSEL